MTQARLSNGVSLAFEVHGDPANPVIFVILGITDNITDWPPGLHGPLVEAGYCVVRHELRDSGLSTKFEHAGRPDLAAAQEALARDDHPPAAYTIHDVADDAGLLLEHLEIRAACVVGYSFGAAVAQLLALKAPGAVAGLVCLQGSNYKPGPAAALARRGTGDARGDARLSDPGSAGPGDGEPSARDQRFAVRDGFTRGQAERRDFGGKDVLSAGNGPADSFADGRRTLP